MNMIAVHSSNVKAIGYDPNAKIMHVEFETGTYVHERVEPDAYRRFMAASSKGSHYHVHFKGGHAGKV